MGLYSTYVVFYTITNGTSFFGNAGGFNAYGDASSSSYTVPTFTVAGSGGSDYISFSQAGTYLLQFTFTCVHSPPTLNSVDVSQSSTLSGITNLGGSKILTSSVNYSDLSFCLLQCASGSKITFPNASALTTLFGANWSATYCTQVNIVRLS